MLSNVVYFLPESHLIKSFLYAAAISALLCGCGTATYVDSSSPLAMFTLSGYHEQGGYGKLYAVWYEGTALSDPKTVREIILYRSAVVSERLGKSYFTLYGTMTNAVEDKPFDDNVIVKESMHGPFLYMLARDKTGPGTLSAQEIKAKYQSKFEPK
jgi:hypothetical protein